MEGAGEEYGYGVCLRCGKLMPAEASFCNSCGAYLKAEPVVGWQGSVAPSLFQGSLMGRPVPEAQLTSTPSAEPPAVEQVSMATTGTPAAAIPPPGPDAVQPLPSQPVPSSYYGYPAVYTQPRTDIMSIVSLVCGIVSFVIPLIPAVAAISLGSTSRERIQESGGELTGENLAMSGIILGIANIVIVVIVVIVVIMTSL